MRAQFGGVNVDRDGEPVGLWFDRSVVDGERGDHIYVDLRPDEMRELGRRIGDAVGLTGEDVDRMYEVAEDWEADVLDALRRRAGLTWECDGGDPERFSHWTNLESDEHCGLCGRARPSEKEA